MQNFFTAQIETFLRAIDKHLTQSFDITIIGGAAAALAYRVVDYTKDIDTVYSIKPIEEACEKAKQETGLDIPIGPVGVEQAPYDYMDRRKRLKIDGLKKLLVYVPEEHDLALMKITRANANDIETIKQLHSNIGLDCDLLVKRFNSEMTHVIGDRKILRLNFLGTIETVFGSEAVKKAERELNERTSL